MRKLAIVLSCFALVLVTGCAKKAKEAPLVGEEELYEEKTAPEAAPTAPGEDLKYKRTEGEMPARGATDAAEGERADLTDVLGGVAEAADIAGELKLIKTADLTCEIDDVDEGFEQVYAVAAAERALVVGTNRAVAEEGYVFGSVTLKVHPSKFDETVRALREIGRLLSESSTTEDVTQEYVDVQARLENAEATRARYLEILAIRAGTVPDILEVEREIERVTENIERFKGQLRYFDAQIGLSTITIHFEQPHAAVPTGYSFGKAVKDAFRIAVRICIFLIQAVIVLLPFIILLIIMVLVIRLIVWSIQRRRRKAKQAAIDA
ncbi:MAG: DUF4349 domain-containing protein [bacterium]